MHHPDHARTGTPPPWRHLFTGDAFHWSFRMRAGDAQAFFAPRDPTGPGQTERIQALDQHPGRYVAVAPTGEPLVQAAWDLAIQWGHATPPSNGSRTLETLGRQWEPDLLFMDHSTMSFAAGCVCLPSSWSLAHTVGKSIDAVHDVVPGLNPEIGAKIRQFLARLQPGKAFCRENWGLTRTGDLNYHPDLGRPRLDALVSLTEVFLRIEHQLFTALPGGVLMGIRIETCPLLDLAADPAAWDATQQAIQTMPNDVAAYKGILPARDAIVREMSFHSSKR